MFIDVVNAGWVPIYNLNLSEDVIGYMGAPAIALSYPWTHFICGHLGRLATRDDVAVHQQYIADIEASAREALASVDPVPYYVAGGENVWAGVKAHLDAVTERAAAPIIAKYTGVLAAADIEVFTSTTTFQIMQSLRLDRGHRQRTGPPLTTAHRGCSGPSTPRRRGGGCSMACQLLGSAPRPARSLALGRSPRLVHMCCTSASRPRYGRGPPLP